MWRAAGHRSGIGRDGVHGTEARTVESGLQDRKTPIQADPAQKGACGLHLATLLPEFLLTAQLSMETRRCTGMYKPRAHTNMAAQGHTRCYPDTHT